MTPADRARASREAQGLPPTIDDPETVARLAALIAAKIGGRDG